jgi:hypothetical protein
MRNPIAAHPHAFRFNANLTRVDENDQSAAANRILMLV